MMPARPSRYLFPVLLALLVLSAVAILYISTPAGAGLANDSAAYIAGARSLLQGKGYSDVWLDSTLEPITHYPPLLSIILAGLGLLGVDPLRGARILDIFLFGLNTALLGLLGWRVARSQAAGIWLAALFLLNASLIRVHLYAMSEAPYVTLSLAAFLFFDLSFSGPRKTLMLVLAGLASGLAFLTRYSALALLPTFLLALFLFHQTWRSRLTAAAIYVAAALPLMAAWFVRNLLAAGNATNRTFQYHPITWDNIGPGVFNASQFLMPIEPWRQALSKLGVWEWTIGALGLVILFWLALRTWQLLKNSPANRVDNPLLFTTGLYNAGYVCAILFSMSFFDASTKFQPRILAPIYICLLVLLVSFAIWLWRKQTRLLQALVVLMAVSTLAFSTYSGLLAVADFKTAGQGYASWKWHDSLIMASLKTLPAGVAIYTNTPPAVYLVTGRGSRVLPTPVDPVDNHVRADYDQNVAEMRANILSGKAVLALFDTANLEDALGTDNIQGQISGLKIIQKAQGDIIYGKP